MAGSLALLMMIVAIIVQWLFFTVLLLILTIPVMWLLKVVRVVSLPYYVVTALVFCYGIAVGWNRLWGTPRKIDTLWPLITDLQAISTLVLSGACCGIWWWAFFNASKKHVQA